MKTKFSVALAISAMIFSAASSPILVAESVRAKSAQVFAEKVSHENQDAIKEATESDVITCTYPLRWLGIC